MPSGHVNTGSQNRYSSTGEIGTKKKKIKYFKGNRLEGITREHPACWQAGTPVNFRDGLPVDAKGRVHGKDLELMCVDVSVKGEPILMLATMDEHGKAIEYHPLIQFFNQVMAGIVKDRMTRDLDALQNKSSARRMWQYLEKKYLTAAELPEVDALCATFNQHQDAENLAHIDWEAVVEAN